MSKTKKIVYYVLLVLVSAGFLMAGATKLMNSPEAAMGFTMVGLPLWLMYFVGVAEIAGVIGLWIPKLARLATYGLEIILVGAVVISIMEMGIMGGIVPFVFIVLLCIIGSLRKQMSAGSMAPSQPASAI